MRGGRGARTALRLMDDPVRFISTVQVGITVSAILLGAIGEPLLSGLFEPPLSATVSFLIAFAILTYLSVVLGELVPKAVALQKAEVLAVALAVPLDWLARIAHPLVWLLQKSANVVLRAPPREARARRDDRLHARGHPPQRRRRRGRRRAPGGRGGDALQGLRLRLEGGLGGDGAAAGGGRDLGRHASRGGARGRRRLAVHALPGLPRVARRDRRRSCTCAISSPRCTTSGSRPCASSRSCGRRTSSRRRRTSPRSSPTSGARSSTWRSWSTSTATMEGIVTLEDVLEEIVGEIEDEFDLPDTSVERIDEKRIRIDGTYTIDDFNEEFGTELEQEDFHTMAGLVFGELGRAPEVGDSVQVGRAPPHRARGRGLADHADRGRVRRRTRRRRRARSCVALARERCERIASSPPRLRPLLGRARSRRRSR